MKYLILALLLVSCSSHKKHGHHHKHHSFSDAQKWAKIFEDPRRDDWQKPDEVIKFAKIKKTSKIADIGSATGYFPVRLAKIATKGMVWGIDVEATLVNYLNQRAKNEKLTNLYSILGTFDDPLIPEPVDHIFIVNTYHHIGNRKHYFSMLKKKLRKNGELVIIDFRKEDLPVGPKKKMKLSQVSVINELKEAGYKLDRQLDTLPYQYVLVFK